MHLTPARHLLHSATDLSNHLACAHLSALNRALALGLIAPPRVYEDPAAEVLKRRGLEHERAFLDALRGEGKRVAEISDPLNQLTSKLVTSSGTVSLDELSTGL
jgi:uncharacterized protein